MVFDAPTLRSTGPAARVGSQPLGVESARVVHQVPDVRLEIGLPKSFARPVRQRRDGGRVHAEQGTEPRRALRLDDRVPQHHTPAIGQCHERLGDDRQSRARK